MVNERRLEVKVSTCENEGKGELRVGEGERERTGPSETVAIFCRLFAVKEKAPAS